MLHYYMHDGPAAFRFELAGDLDVNDAARLEQDWRTASSTIGDRRLVIDLSFVTSIDEAGLSLLRRWHAEGAQFAAISPQSGKLVETITGRPFSPRQPQEPTYQPWLSGGLRSLAMTLPAISLLALMTLLTPSVVQAADAGASMAFARYVSTVVTNRGVANAIDSSDIVVEIDGSLPKLGKQGRMEAIRHLGVSGQPGYEIVSLVGDSTVKHEVIARYLAIEQQAYTRPASSFAVTPENYKFRYTGSIESGGDRVYVFSIKPRHHEEGLMEGQIWIDQATGAVVHQGGRLWSRKSIFIRKITFARDTGPRADTPYVRVTHIEIDTRFFGPADITIRERPSAAILNAGGLQ